MEERNPLYTGEDAKRLKEDPVLIDAFAALEKALLDQAVMCERSDDDARYRCIVGVQVLRMINKHFDKLIFDGKSASKIAQAIADNKAGWEQG